MQKTIIKSSAILFILIATCLGIIFSFVKLSTYTKNNRGKIIKEYIYFEDGNQWI